MIRNWVLERMALKIHLKGSKDVHKDNLFWIAGVNVEIKKRKMIRGWAWWRVKVEVGKTIFFFVFKITGKLGSKITTAKPSLDG